MIFSKASISALNPCKDRFDNFLNKYKDKEFTPRQFMGLKSITQEDKMWVAFRLMPQENVSKAAADIAESTLHLYESVYPEDARPHKAVEAARDGNYAAAEAASDAASEAAYEVSDAAAESAAYSAAEAARSAAYSSADAVEAAAYSARSASKAAALSADSDPEAQALQEKKIRTIVLKYLK